MNEPETYVALLECCAGNAEVGNMWIETRVCTAETTIAELMAWKESKTCMAHGRLMLTKARP